MNSRDRLKSLLLQLSYEEKEVTLASGKKSNFYFDGRQTALHPEGASLLGELFLEEIQKISPQIEAVGGPTLGADPLVTAVALLSFKSKKPLPAFIIRKEPKKHGTANWIEGLKNLRVGSRVAILEDVVTSGESSIAAAKRSEESGLVVTHILCIVDREEGGREAIEKKGYRFVSLFTKTELLKK